MKVKLLDKPYNQELSPELIEVVMGLNDKMDDLIVQGKISYDDFTPFPEIDGIVVTVKRLEVLPLFGIEHYEIIEP